nr:MAG TPA: hypothetical protein [Caudoviricetes sp.]DAJ80375.1 MAG TPA: hypothetical protein [Caudoviricetes sp.]
MTFYYLFIITYFCKICKLLFSFIIPLYFIFLCIMLIILNLYNQF